MTLLLPYTLHQPRLGLSVDHGHGPGTHLHVLDVLGLGAHCLHHVVTLIIVLDHHAPSHLLLVTVSLEGGHADLLVTINIVQLTRAVAT